MRNTVTLILIIAFNLNGFTQTQVEVASGAGYVNDVYYNFEDGALNTVARNGWDIAFAREQMSVSILANHGNGLMLYTYPNGTINDWSSVDTTGMEWHPLYNSVENWEQGAFNANTVAGNVFDYGWGVYNLTNHFITGDSLYVLTLPDGKCKKFAVVRKDAVNNQYIFKYADIDGSNEVTETFDADDYNASFVYYSVDSGRFVEQEPADRWQLLFTRYYDYHIPYYVTGVLANSGVRIQEVRGVDQSGYDDFELPLFNDTISQIGSDWKSFNMETFQYDVADDVVFFVQDTLDGEAIHPVWKIYFTAFGGSTDGMYTFMQEKLADEITGTNITAAHHVSVFPNPAGNEVNIIQDLGGNIRIMVHNSGGMLVLHESFAGNSGLTIRKLNTGSLPPGIYTVTIHSDNELQTLKLLKK